ncbi:MAG: hypothetical protein KF699_03630 [Phycisphaeraceae bacterium]|nr:hypothetical protein [Phycisphaeraceae bacterium]MBX3405598.1 hypothetical protein [Phycisphaeraceae bacterium]
MDAMPRSPCVTHPPALSSAVCAFAILAGAAVIAPLAVVALVAPRFMEIFRDFGVALPLLTQEVIRLGTNLASPLGAVLLLVIGLGIAGSLCLAWRAHRLLGLSVLLASLTWLLVASAIITVSLFIPLVAMIQSLQQAGAP